MDWWGGFFDPDVTDSLIFRKRGKEAFVSVRLDSVK